MPPTAFDGIVRTNIRIQEGEKEMARTRRAAAPEPAPAPRPSPRRGRQPAPEPEPASNGHRDFTAYANKDITSTMRVFADWIIEVTGIEFANNRAEEIFR